MTKHKYFSIILAICYFLLGKHRAQSDLYLCKYGTVIVVLYKKQNKKG